MIYLKQKQSFKLINLENFKFDDDLTKTEIGSLMDGGLMYADNILAPEVVNELLQWDTWRSDQINLRQALRQFYVIDPDFKGEEFKNTTRLLRAISTFDTLWNLMERSFAGAKRSSLSNYWLTKEHLRQVYKPPIMMLWKDAPGYFLTPHLDNNTIVANLQIYLDPEESNLPIGTRWHYFRNHEESVVVPWRRNYGYFNVNCQTTFHSVENCSDSWRKSVVITWRICQ